MIALIGSIINGLTMIFSGAALVIGFGASYLVWQIALKNKSSRLIMDAESESEVIKKEKILQAKERFFQLKT